MEGMELFIIFGVLVSLIQIIQNFIIMANLTELEQEVSENQTIINSTITLLKGLKQALDEAGTDPVKLKMLSKQLSDNTDVLSAAVVENTTAAEGSPE